MDLASRKLQLMEKIMGVFTPESIEKIENFFNKEIDENKNFNDELPEIVSQLLEQSKEDSLNGNVKIHEDVIKEARERYNAL